MQIKNSFFRVFLTCLFGVLFMIASERANGQNGLSASLINGSIDNDGIVVLDDFSGDLSNFSSTVILDVNGGASNGTNFAIDGGALELNTTSFDDIEQLAFVYDGASLNVGDELQADFSDFSGDRNFGLYVGGTAPTTGVREDHISLYGGSDGTSNRIFVRGFDGGSEYARRSSDIGASDNSRFPIYCSSRR